MKIAIIGAGAIGSIIGGLLAKAGEDVTLIGRQPHVDAVNKNGLAIDGALGSMNIKVKAAEKLDFKPDVAFITVKTQDIAAAAEEHRQYLADTLLVSVQNGVEADNLLAHIFGKEHILSCVVLFGGTFLEPGKVTYAPAGRLLIGEPFDGAVDERVRHIAAILNKAIPTKISTNIKGAHWTKMVLNENNALPAITGLSLQEVGALPDMRTLLVLLIRETVRVAEASGERFASLPKLPVPVLRMLLWAPMPVAELLPKMFTRAMGKRPVLGSTLQSIKRGEKTEIDYLNGVVVRLGREHNLPTPHNAAVVKLVHEVESTGKYMSVAELAELVKNLGTVSDNS